MPCLTIEAIYDSFKCNIEYLLYIWKKYEGEKHPVQESPVNRSRGAAVLVSGATGLKALNLW